MKSFKEIVNFVIDHGTGVMHYHEGICLEVHWFLEKDEDTKIHVGAEHFIKFNKLEISVTVFEKDKDPYTYYLGQDYSRLVRKVNELEIIPC